MDCRECAAQRMIDGRCFEHKTCTTCAGRCRPRSVRAAAEDADPACARDRHLRRHRSGVVAERRPGRPGHARAGRRGPAGRTCRAARDRRLRAQGQRRHLLRLPAAGHGRQAAGRGHHAGAGRRRDPCLLADPLARAAGPRVPGARSEHARLARCPEPRPVEPRRGPGTPARRGPRGVRRRARRR